MTSLRHIAGLFIATMASLTAFAEPMCHVVATNGKAPAQIILEDMTTSFPEISAKLAKGLSVTVLHEVTQSGKAPFLFGCKVYYDLWDETYGITPFAGNLRSVKASVLLKDKNGIARLCQTGALPWNVENGDTMHVTSYLDPVSDEQIAKTRQWLAEKGIGAGAGPLLGRAAYAMVNLNEQRAISRSCKAAAP